MSAIGEKLAAQQRATAARALAAMERAHLAERWERQREAERAWAYFRAGQPVPDEMPALTRARAILSAKALAAVARCWAASFSPMALTLRPPGGGYRERRGGRRT